MTKGDGTPTPPGAPPAPSAVPTPTPAPAPPGAAGGGGGAGGADADGTSWRAFWQRVLDDVLTPHFLIAGAILLVWTVSIVGPIWSVGDLIAGLAGKDGNTTSTDAARQALPDAVSATTAISGIFTSILALVLGHYFGQRAGAVLANEERKEKERIARAGAEGVEEAGALAEEKSRADAALREAVQLLADKGVEVEADSELARYLNLGGSGT